MPALRAEMKRFLDLAGLPAAYTDKLCLSLSEVISNLVRHPPQKAERMDITIETGTGGVRLDVADDSTPFATFDAICKTALARMRAAESMAENGYGIGCVLVQHTRVTYTPAAQSADGRNHFTIDDRKANPAEKTETPAQKTPKRKPVIFLVDDDAGDLKAHHRMLSGLYDVVPLPDAASALALFRVQRPDLVISDLHMPQMDGTALRRQISTLPDGDTVPFVFLSASSEGINDTGILRLGIDDYLIKPVSTQSLARTAARILGRREQLGRAIEERFHRDIQKYLHPSLPAAAGPWRVTTLNRMADVGGGDFTLHHQTPDGLLAVIADVMGHGVQAKFFAYAYAGYLRSLFRATAQTTAQENGDANTSVFLQRLSDAVTDDDFLDGTLLTCQSFHLGRGGDVRISSAGHPPPVLIQGGRASPLPVMGALAGMAGHSGYDEYRRTLMRGDKILFATDGFFDVFTRDADDDATTPPALLALLDAHGGGTGEQLAHRLWQAFENNIGGYTRAVDDATLIIAAYEGEPL